jgi:hypothetical protein
VDQEFMAWMHAHFGCLVAEHGFGGCSGPATFHHVRNCGSVKDDRAGLILCFAHHQHDGGPESLERMGRTRWQAHFDIDIPTEVERNQQAYLDSGHQFKQSLAKAA